MNDTRRSPPRAAGALGLVALLVAGCATNPATGQRQLSFFSTSEEIELGQESDREIVAGLGLYTDPQLEAYVAAIGRRLAASSERPELPWTFRVVDDPTVNAFALPGGYIYVTRGILGHLGSEAELAAVLGHEIGHVTARHGVHELSRQLLIVGGLALGVLLLPEEDQTWAGALLAAGMGLLFLKYSRDDERQADDLGLRYLASGGYDPAEMPDVFTLLERVSRDEGGGPLPAWLSTHPRPERRRERSAEAVSSLPRDPAGARVGDEDYLAHLDGLAFGADPRRGFVRDGLFVHPGWRLGLRVPEGWQLETGAAGASFTSPEEDALLLLEAVEETSARAAAAAFFAQEGVEGGAEEQVNLGGLRALKRRFDATEGEQTLSGFAAFVEHGGRVVRFLGLTAADDWGEREAILTRTLATLWPITDREALAVEPARIEILALPRAMSIEEFAAAYPSSVPVATLALLNGVGAGDRLEAGRKVKRVVGGPPPG